MAIPPASQDRIVALAATGLSRALIADEVGHGITRSAVCSLLWRKGIRRRAWAGHDGARSRPRT